MAIFGTEASLPVQWLGEGLGLAQRVGRVHRNEEPNGSGFLLDGCTIDASLNGLPLFVTCDFALGWRPGQATDELGWQETSVVFEGRNPAASDLTVYHVADLVAHVPALHLVALLLDEPPGHLHEISIAPSPPDPGRAVIVVSYPMGGGLAVTLRDNDSLGIRLNSKYGNRHDLMYRAPTEPGSSGGPVFNEHWELAAMHVGTLARGREPELANFGIPVNELLRGLREAIMDSTSAVAKYRAAGVRRILPPDQSPERESSPKTEAPAEPREYYSAFLSYSHKDKLFASRLYKKLRALGVAVWWDQVQMRIGDDIYARINEMRRTDKVILCCSESSLTSLWVDNELKLALEKERRLREKHDSTVSVVLPLDLDGFLQQWKGPLSAQFVSRNRADFVGWEEKDVKFEVGVEKVARALQVRLKEADAFPEPKLK